MQRLLIKTPQVRRRVHIRSPTTVVATSEDSEENYPSEQFYNCWSAVAQPAHTMPTQKEPKKKAKQVRFNADALTHNAETPHANETREE
eukprot:4843478-Amphidinium_carterae.1